MKALVDAGAKVSIKAADGTTVALAAAGSGNLDAVKYALELDPDLTAIGPEGKSIMHFAIANKNPDLAIPVLQYLADKGAKLDVPKTKGDTPGDFINRGGQQDIRHLLYSAAEGSRHCEPPRPLIVPTLTGAHWGTRHGSETACGIFRGDRRLRGCCRPARASLGVAAAASGYRRAALCFGLRHHHFA